MAAIVLNSHIPTLFHLLEKKYGPEGCIGRELFDWEVFQSKEIRVLQKKNFAKKLFLKSAKSLRSKRKNELYYNSFKSNLSLLAKDLFWLKYQSGFAKTDLKSYGIVNIFGVEYQAFSDSGFIRRGSGIKVLEIDSRGDLYVIPEEMPFYKKSM
ncbi:MAG: hypothetical protein AAFY45_08355 [Bacteroidota bacterium]